MAALRWLCVLAMLNALPIARSFAEAPRIAIIIDDIGYSLISGRRAIALPVPVTLAVLPYTPNARALAASARDAGQDVILHQPMEAMEAHRHPHSGHRRTLTATMGSKLLRAELRESLRQVPNAIGISNHTGSLLTSRTQSMRWLMEEVRAQGLFFLDSRTTHETVARKMARATGVPSVKRDVFLDHVVDPGAIAGEFARALRLADRQGYAVLIGHPHEQTLSFLEQQLPTLSSRGYRVVPVSVLVERPVSRRAVLAQLETRASLHTTLGL